MREIRTLELQQDEPTTCWLIDRPQTLRVCEGLLWVTVEGEPDDRWLSAGDSLELSSRSTVWISSSTPSSRFVLAAAPARSLTRFLAFNWMPVRLVRNRYRTL
jgi:hypothetical protein